MNLGPADLAFFSSPGRACWLTTLIRIAGHCWPVDQHTASPVGLTR